MASAANHPGDEDAHTYYVIDEDRVPRRLREAARFELWRLARAAAIGVKGLGLCWVRPVDGFDSTAEYNAGYRGLQRTFGGPAAAWCDRGLIHIVAPSPYSDGVAETPEAVRSVRHEFMHYLEQRAQLRPAAGLLCTRAAEACERGLISDNVLVFLGDARRAAVWLRQSDEKAAEAQHGPLSYAPARSPREPAREGVASAWTEHLRGAGLV